MTAGSPLSGRHFLAPLAILLIAVFSVHAGTGDAEKKRSLRLRGNISQRAIPFDPSRPIVRDVGANESVRFLFAVDPAARTGDSPHVFRLTAQVGWRKRVLFERTIERPSGKEANGWHYGAGDLTPFRGQKVKLRFECRAGRKNVTGALWAGLRFGDFRRADGQYNIVLISLDTLRADRLGIHGHTRDTSPNIDALARSGVFFEHGVAASPWTKPSHATMFSGLYPSSHRLTFRPQQEGGFTKISSAIRMLPEILRENGYLTAAFAGGGNVSYVHGFDRGFDLFHERRRTAGRDAVSNFREATEWVRNHKDDRFFLFVHTFEIHEPYRHRSFVEPGMSRMESISARYDSGIRFTDRVLGKFLGSLHELGLTESTLIVLTSDHGDELFDHGYTSSHGHSLYEDQIHVPFIFNNPARLKPRAIDSFQVHHVDLAPTILEFAGIPPIKEFQGRSLVPILEGGDAPSESVAFSEMEFHVGGSRRVRKRQMKSVRYLAPGEFFKLILSPGLVNGRDGGRLIDSSNHRGRVWRDLLADGGQQLFNLAIDKKEAKNLSRTNPVMTERLSRKLELLEALESGLSHDVEVFDETVSGDLKEQLRSLGY